MRIRLAIFLAAPLTLLSACATPSVVYPSEASAVLNDFTRTEAYRVGSLDDHPGYGGKVDNFAALETAQISPDIAKSSAAAIALDPTNFRDTTQPGNFVPTVAWRFYRHLPDGEGQDAVDVLVSFEIDEVLIVSRDAHLHEFFRRLVASEPGRLRLLELARETFPKDSDLANIPDVRDSTATTQSD